MVRRNRCFQAGLSECEYVRGECEQRAGYILSEFEQNWRAVYESENSVSRTVSENARALMLRVGDDRRGGFS
jgi:hypothetical protein